MHTLRRIGPDLCRSGRQRGFARTTALPATTRTPDHQSVPHPEHRLVSNRDPTARRVPSRFLRRLDSLLSNPKPIDYERRERGLQKTLGLSEAEIERLRRDGYLHPKPKVVRTSGNAMANLDVVFLGTSAGSPSTLRNVSSTLLRMDGESWVFDCGEGTTRQLMSTSVKPHTIRKIFITHLHADHVLGLIGLLIHLGTSAQSHSEMSTGHSFTDLGTTDIYGPSGLRALVRMNLRFLKVHSMYRRWRVHELLKPGDFEEKSDRLGKMEEAGRNIFCGETGEGEGLWRNVVKEESGLAVDAVRLEHTVECVGYVVREPNRREKFDMSVLGPLLDAHSDEIKALGYRAPRAILSTLEGSQSPITLPQSGLTLHPPALSIPGRCVAILGDTSDASRLERLFPPDQSGRVERGPDLLVHESTGTALPDLSDDWIADVRSNHRNIIPSLVESLASEPSTFTSRLPSIPLGTRQEELAARQKMRERGHSTSRMAGELASRIGAKLLVMNHLSARGPSPWSGVRPPIWSSPAAKKAGKKSGQTTTTWSYPDHPSGAALKSVLKPSAISRLRSMNRLQEAEGQARAERFVAEAAWVRAMEQEAEEGWREESERRGGGTEAKVVAAWDFLAVSLPIPR